jgi:hypothetical protein
MINPVSAREVLHGDHVGTHSKGDGHMVINHNDHMDHLHNGHLHQVHSNHIDEHSIEVSDLNPTGEHKDGHGQEHANRDADGHPTLQHGNHFDHLHNGHLHHVHGDHSGEHGTVKIVK